MFTCTCGKKTVNKMLCKHMMVNFKFGEEMKNDVINMCPSTDQKKKKPEPPTGIEPMIFGTPVGRCFNH